MNKERIPLRARADITTKMLTTGEDKWIDIYNKSGIGKIVKGHGHKSDLINEIDYRDALVERHKDRVKREGKKWRFSTRALTDPMVAGMGNEDRAYDINSFLYGRIVGWPTRASKGHWTFDPNNGFIKLNGRPV